MAHSVARPSASLPHPQFTLDLCRYQLPAATFYTATAAGELNHVRHTAFAARSVASDDVESAGVTVEMSEWHHASSVHLLVKADDGALALIQGYGGQQEGRPLHVQVSVAAREPSAAQALGDRLHEALGSAEPAEHLVPMTFWARAQNGARQMHKLIAAPSWEEIAENYASGARSSLERLMATGRLDGGRLILWQGPPGTGKTYALRALARAWRAWCDFHVVIDPDIFFGEDSSYLVDILFLDPGRDTEGRHKARLLVLEDAGELVAADARTETGQALSRLLNVSDGLLGQGLDLCTLITTNEPIEKLHPAVLRPGRCAAQVEVPPLDIETANRWLEDHGNGTAVSQPTTVAELFAKTQPAVEPLNRERGCTAATRAFPVGSYS